MENSIEKEPNFFQRNLEKIASVIRDVYKKELEKSKNEQALLRPESFLNPLAKNLKANASNSIEKYSAKLFDKAVKAIKDNDEHLITIVNQKDLKLALVFSSISESPEIRESAERIIKAVQEIKSNSDFHQNVLDKANDEFKWKGVALNSSQENTVNNQDLRKRVEAELTGGTMALEYDPRVTSLGLETVRNMEKMAAKVVLQVLKENNVSQGLDSINKKVIEAGRRNGMNGLEDLNTFVQNARGLESSQSKGR